MTLPEGTSGGSCRKPSTAGWRSRLKRRSACAYRGLPKYFWLIWAKESPGEKWYISSSQLATRGTAGAAAAGGIGTDTGAVLTVGVAPTGGDMRLVSALVTGL